MLLALMSTCFDVIGRGHDNVCYFCHGQYIKEGCRCICQLKTETVAQTT